MFVTNDVALFVTVPLTLGLARMVELPVGRLVIFQALAVNAGSALLPIGFGKRTLSLSDTTSPFLPNHGLMTLSLAAYPLFLLAANAGFAAAGALAIIGVFALRFRQVLRGVDWGLLPVFILMFINMGLLGQNPVIGAAVGSMMQGPGSAFIAGAGLSQITSNVPAAIFLAPFTEEWRALAWGVNVGGVNVGGFGLVIGALANLIALRFIRQPGIWWQFHLWSLPTFILCLTAGAVLLGL